MNSRKKQDMGRTLGIFVVVTNCSVPWVKKKLSPREMAMSNGFSPKKGAFIV
jgi:hypothetical protein